VILRSIKDHTDITAELQQYHRASTFQSHRSGIPGSAHQFHRPSGRSSARGRRWWASR
jgi:hypothetical protein